MQLGCVPDLSPPKMGDANRAKGPPTTESREPAVSDNDLLSLGAVQHGLGIWPVIGQTRAVPEP